MNAGTAARLRSLPFRDSMCWAIISIGLFARITAHGDRDHHCQELPGTSQSVDELRA
jgi:hypothetical protein